jgi:hypothetical protein
MPVYDGARFAPPALVALRRPDHGPSVPAQAADMTSHRKPTLAFWLTVAVVGLPILYIASFGPACWVTARAHDPVRSPRPPRWMVIYWPLGTVVHRGWPGCLVLTRWSTLCVRSGNIAVMWADHSDYGGAGWIERGS